MLFNRDGAIISANDAASRWLAEIYGEDPSTNWFEILAGLQSPDVDAAIPIIPLIARAHAVASGGTRGKPDCACATAPAVGSCCTPQCSPARRATATWRSSWSQPRVAISLRSSSRRTGSPPGNATSYGPSRGSSTPEIAAELFLSAHTVRDYIKAVFDKVGVSSRGELVAKLFAEHYADPFHETLVEVH